MSYAINIVRKHPNARRLTMLIDVLCNYGKVSKALNLLKEMKDEGFAPIVHTYNILIFF
jgi:pentatricopeptide repeat protein